MFQIKFDEEYNVTVTEKGRGDWECVRQGFVNVFVGFDGENEMTVQYYSDYRLRNLVLTMVGCGATPKSKVITWESESYDDLDECNQIINDAILNFTGQNPDDDYDTWPYAKEGVD